MNGRAVFVAVCLVGWLLSLASWVRLYQLNEELRGALRGSTETLATLTQTLTETTAALQACRGR